MPRRRKRVPPPGRAGWEDTPQAGFDSGKTDPAMEGQSWATKVTSGGRVVLPAEARTVLGLKDGSGLRIVLEGGQLVLIPYLEVVRRLQEKYRRRVPGDHSLADDLIAERRAEAARD